MRAALMVEREVAADPGPRFARVRVGVEVDLLVLERTPHALDEHVVEPAALAVHADLDAVLAQYPREGLGGELRPLVGVEDLRRRVARERLLERIDAEARLQRVRQP